MSVSTLLYKWGFLQLAAATHRTSPTGRLPQDASHCARSLASTTERLQRHTWQRSRHCRVKCCWKLALHVRRAACTFIQCPDQMPQLKWAFAELHSPWMEHVGVFKVSHQQTSQFETQQKTLACFSDSVCFKRETLEHRSWKCVWCLRPSSSCEADRGQSNADVRFRVSCSASLCGYSPVTSHLSPLAMTESL